MTGCWQWKRGTLTGHTRSYHITRNERVISTIDITCDVPDHAWHLGNIVDVFRQIERSNQPRTLRAVDNPQGWGHPVHRELAGKTQGCPPGAPQAGTVTMEANHTDVITGVGSSSHTDPTPHRPL